MLTLAEIDEAINHARAVPVEERNAGWYAFVDSLLEQRVQLASTAQQRRETRVVTFSETR